MNTIEIRNNNLKNVRAILSKVQTLNNKQCEALSEFFKIMSKEELSTIDSRMADRTLAEGRFNVLLPY